MFEEAILLLDTPSFLIQQLLVINVLATFFFVEVLL